MSRSSRVRNYLSDYGWFALGMILFLVGPFLVSVVFGRAG